jgi:hypothetical protein
MMLASSATFDNSRDRVFEQALNGKFLLQRMDINRDGSADPPIAGRFCCKSSVLMGIKAESSVQAARILTRRIEKFDGLVRISR